MWNGHKARKTYASGFTDLFGWRIKARDVKTKVKNAPVYLETNAKGIKRQSVVFACYVNDGMRT